MLKPLNVLSLFDGIGSGYLAFERAGVSVNKYFSSEINEYAMQVANKRIPGIVQIGDVRDINAEDLPNIDIIIGGSPCRGFSYAGKQLNFKDSKSRLFFEFVRLMKECNPDYFMLENVKMKQEFQDIISDYLGVNPIEIDSSLVSAQSRKRLYWTNIAIKDIKDRNILLKDIVHENTGELTRKDLEEFIVPFDESFIFSNSRKGKIGYFRKDSQANRVYSIDRKAVTLCGNSGGGAAKMGQYLFGSTDGKSIDGYIRKLTPTECERLQNIPDNFTYVSHPKVKGRMMSKTQRYKMLGNGWTVDIVSSIFEGLKRGK